MASLGHLAVGLAVARVAGAGSPERRATATAILCWSALSFLPDADVVGFAFGVRYEDEWGHRGATHSLLFSLALGAGIGLAASLLRRPRLRTGVMATVVLASHALLDTLTNGGLGCALFWPFDQTRYFAPWTPIPVSPIATEFAAGFSEAGLGEIERGQASADVRARLGVPFAEFLLYEDLPVQPSAERGLLPRPRRLFHRRPRQRGGAAMDARVTVSPHPSRGATSPAGRAAAGNAPPAASSPCPLR